MDNQVPAVVAFTTFLNETQSPSTVEAVKTYLMEGLMTSPIFRKFLMDTMYASLTTKSSDYADIEFSAVMSGMWDCDKETAARFLLLAAMSAGQGDPWKSCIDDKIGEDFETLESLYRRVVNAIDLWEVLDNN